VDTEKKKSFAWPTECGWLLGTNHGVTEDPEENRYYLYNPGYSELTGLFAWGARRVWGPCHRERFF
jgi:hypothetical protein